MLLARALTMEFPGVKALGGVDFDLQPGEIHALCGENGAGKSTLINILGGVIPQGKYGGAVEFQGRPCRFAGPADALQAGIRTIHQELALCEDLSVAENVCLGEEPTRYGLLDRRRMESETQAQLETLGLADLHPRTSAATLSVGVKQMVEIARALRQKSKVLILDEPTSALSHREAENLEAVLGRLRDEGVAILYISHRLDEVFRLADRITVLRNGESKGTLLRSEFDPARIVSLLVGRKSGEVFPPRSLPGQKPDSAPPLLTVQHWSVPSAHNPDKKALEDLSFEIEPGEIVGLVGLMGSGRTELVESLCGLYPRRGRGDLRLDGKPYSPRDSRWAWKQGLALLSEDRRGHGIMPDKSVRANMTYASLRTFSRGGWIRQSEEKRAVESHVTSLRIKTPDADFPIANLSGGNQQKVMLGRCLLARPRLLILDEPTRGIDVGAKAEIYRLIQSLAAAGMGVLLISSENEEVLRLSHRVLVLRNGKVVERRAGGELELQEAMALATGGQA